jgi:Epoxide hydrolase N terminus
VTFAHLRALLAIPAVALGVCLSALPSSGQGHGPTEDRSIRAFKVHMPQKALDDLRERIKATRWPDGETVADRSQGIQLAELRQLVQYWGSGYD